MGGSEGTALCHSLPQDYTCIVCGNLFKAYHNSVHVHELNGFMKFPVCETCRTSADEISVKKAVRAENAPNPEKSDEFFFPGEILDAEVQKILDQYRNPTCFRS